MFGIARLIRGFSAAPAPQPAPVRKIRQRSRLGDIVEERLSKARPSIRLRPARCVDVAPVRLRQRPDGLPSFGYQRTMLPARMVLV